MTAKSMLVYTKTRVSMLFLIAYSLGTFHSRITSGLAYFLGSGVMSLYFDPFRCSHDAGILAGFETKNQRMGVC